MIPYISLQEFTVYMENSRGFEIIRSEICTDVSFTSLEVMRTLLVRLPYTERKCYPEVNSQTGAQSYVKKQLRNAKTLASH